MHQVQAAATPITFPVIGATRYSDDFGNPRVGHTHEGNDIMGVKHQRLVAAADGYIRYVPYPEASYGYAVYIDGDNGFTYAYLHINNDRLGTDDGQGDGMLAYAPDIERPNRVVAGQLIGWMGDSGNAEATTAHLHFEIRDTENDPTNPYETLRAATRIDRPVIPPALENETLPFGQFIGGASLAYGELHSSTGSELLVGAGQGGGPLVQTYSATMQRLGQFYAFSERFRGGVEVAAGDFDGNGEDEIVVAPGPDRTPEVRVFLPNGILIGRFLAFGENFRGGLHIATADLDDDGIDEIVVSAGPGGGPQVRIFTSHGTLIGQFFAFGQAFRGGVFVAATDATETTPATIVTSAGAGGGPHVRIFDSHGILQRQFFAYASDFRGGVRVATGDLVGSDGVPEIVTIPAQDGPPLFKVYDAATGAIVATHTAFEEWWRGGFAAVVRIDSLYVVSVGGRRTSIRQTLGSDGF